MVQIVPKIVLNEISSPRYMALEAIAEAGTKKINVVASLVPIFAIAIK